MERLAAASRTILMRNMNILLAGGMFLALALGLLVASPAQAHAAPITVGDFKIVATNDRQELIIDADYSYIDNTLSILSDKSVTISMASGQTTRDCIVVPATNTNANITLAGVSIDLGNTSILCAFAIEPGASANVTLAEGTENTLISSAWRAGLEVAQTDSKTASVIIGGTGSLTAKCSGTMIAYGAGIGGGYGSYATGNDGGNITITGGTVTAVCEGLVIDTSHGAGIGGGYCGFSGTVAISGGRVKAQSKSDVAPIGNGLDYEDGKLADVSITAGMFPAADKGKNTVYGIDLSDGRCVYDSGDAVYPYAVGWTKDLKVEGGVQGEDYSYDYTTGVLSIDKATPLTISMREGIAQATHNCIVVPEGVAANLALAGVDIDQSGNHDGCAFRVAPGASASITLVEGSENSLVSGSSRAGLHVSGAVEDKPASVVISGSGSLTAKCVNRAGFAYAAGIGGSNNEPAGDITISGGTVYASCESSGDGSSVGAGIGGGSTATGGKISITGGTVNASCKGGQYSFGAAIGGGIYGYGGTIAISGGRVTAQSGPGLAIGDGEAPIVGDPAVVSITGGLFGEGSVDGDTVYGVSVGTLELACAVANNPDGATAAAYPVGVGEKVEYAPLLKPNEDLVYTGSALKASDFSLTAPGTSLGESELKGAATFMYATRGSEPSIDGLPTDAGTYTVRATLPEKILYEEAGVYACYVATGAADADVAIEQAEVPLDVKVDKTDTTTSDANAPSDLAPTGDSLTTSIAVVSVAVLSGFAVALAALCRVHRRGERR